MHGLSCHCRFDSAASCFTVAVPFVDLALLVGFFCLVPLNGTSEFGSLMLKSKIGHCYLDNSVDFGLINSIPIPILIVPGKLVKLVPFQHWETDGRFS